MRVVGEHGASPSIEWRGGAGAGGRQQQAATQQVQPPASRTVQLLDAQRQASRHALANAAPLRAGQQAGRERVARCRAGAASGVRPQPANRPALGASSRWC